MACNLLYVDVLFMLISLIRILDSLSLPGILLFIFNGWLKSHILQLLWAAVYFLLYYDSMSDHITTGIGLIAL
jgi:hypothetical protein